MMKVNISFSPTKQHIYLPTYVLLYNRGSLTIATESS